MFRKPKQSDAQAKLDALDRSLATIEFAMDGTVLDANRNFLDAIGYELDEIKGRHHRIFVEAAYAESADYRAFWETLRGGKYASGEFPVSASPDARSGWKPPTTRCSGRTASRSG